MAICPAAGEWGTMGACKGGSWRSCHLQGCLMHACFLA